MRPMRLLLLLLATGVALPGLAHHGISNWDLNKDLALTGTITRIDFISPHAWLHLAVKGADGRIQTGPARCVRRIRCVVPAGQWRCSAPARTVTVTGSPERYKPRQCYLSTIRFADGTSMDRYGQRQLPAAEKAKVAAVATGAHRPTVGRIWPATGLRSSA